MEKTSFRCWGKLVSKIVSRHCPATRRFRRATDVELSSLHYNRSHHRGRFKMSEYHDECYPSFFRRVA